MKIVRFTTTTETSYGVLEGDMVHGLLGDPFEILKFSQDNYHLKDVRLLAPCVPTKIVALGLNYQSHQDEFKDKPALDLQPTEPLIFLKPSTAVIGPDDKIIYPASSNRVEYESEMAVVIKKRARAVPAEKASDYILGYTCLNDVTARDLQMKDQQWTRGKGFDTFAPIGPCIETEINLTDTVVEGYLNGMLKQKGKITDLINPVSKLINFISNVMTLLPGDVIATGTPAGVGQMQPGDSFEIKIEGIGTLRNQVVKSV